MDGLLPRLLASFLLAVLGGVLGTLAGWAFDLQVLGAVIGAGLGAVAATIHDSVKAYRLVNWLRGSQRKPAPRDAGLWGELAYRAEKAILKREQELQDERQRREQFLSGIEASPNGVLLVDGNDQIEWCNSVAAEHFGLDPQRDLQQRVTNLVRSPAFVSYLQGANFAEAISFPRPGGAGTLSVLVRAYGDGMKLVLSQDITEREKADLMRRDFVANVSHEIRTPLTVLSGFVDTLGNLPLTEAERRRVLLLMGQQTQRMQALVSDLLTLAQLEGGPRPAVDRWTSLARMLSQIEVDATALSAGRHRIGKACPPDLQVAGVEAELLSAISNLMTNAIRYTPDGGQVDISARQLPGGGAEIAVKDTGIGVAREHIPRLTERFYRVDGSRSRETGGTGLGLSIVKHIVQRHGGNLDIQSEPGRGSTFRIVLPSQRMRSSTSPPAVAGRTPAPRSASDASLDDHPVISVTRVPGLNDAVPPVRRDGRPDTPAH
jgi:two-component system, OmpR family, phosphate regulon sensor histidine kinase PhoR